MVKAATLDSKQVRFLRGLAHKLNPAVQTGKDGYTPAIVKEIARNLSDHELIKVRIGADERAEFLELAEQMAADTGAVLVQTIGRIAVLYREAEDPVIQLPRGKAAGQAPIIKEKSAKTARPGARPGRKKVSFGARIRAGKNR